MRKIILIVCVLTMAVLPAVAYRPFVVSSYIRGNFFNKGRVTSESMNACNDLICLGVHPGGDGDLMYDDLIAPQGRGAKTVPALLDSVALHIKNRDRTKLRLGISGGKEWRTMIESVEARNHFAVNVKDFLKVHNLDGVDLDFEWPQSDEEFDNYSEVIVILREYIGEDYILTVSLHPLYYKISRRAIEAVDYVSLQCYGPNPVRFSYDQFVSDIQKVRQYGIPAEKLVAGVPFYGVAKDGSRKTIAYYNLVMNNLIQSPAEDEARYMNTLYLYNGQDMIMQKTQYAMKQDLRGLMSWDLATDVPFADRWSLLKAMVGMLD